MNHTSDTMLAVELYSDNLNIDIACRYALAFIGIPYIWGGNNPLEGFDCSGFVQEVLASVGMDPPGDQTADTLYRMLKDEYGITEEPGPGALVFFGTGERIIHVGFCLTDKIMIEAGGGGRSCRDRDSAAKKGAFVRIRPIHRRRDIVSFVMPNY